MPRDSSHGSKRQSHRLTTKSNEKACPKVSAERRYADFT